MKQIGGEGSVLYALSASCRRRPPSTPEGTTGALVRFPSPAEARRP